jgi:hypothetical protein
MDNGFLVCVLDSFTDVNEKFQPLFSVRCACR